MSKKGGTGTGAPQEVAHATLKGGTALEYPPQALNVGKVRKHMNRDQCKT